MESQVALIGRSESCQVVLRDESVSRFHASLIRTSKGVWIVDLLAREGVSVNGVKVRWAWLDEGDEVRIGHFTFILRYDAPPGQITRRDVPLEAGASPKAASGVDSSRTQGRGKTLALRSTNGSQGTLAVNKSSPHPLDPGDRRAESPGMGTGRSGPARAVCHVAAADADDGVIPQRHDPHGADVRGDAPRASVLGPRRARPGSEAHRRTCRLAGEAGGDGEADRSGSIAGQRPSGTEWWTCEWDGRCSTGVSPQRHRSSRAPQARAGLWRLPRTRVRERRDASIPAPSFRKSPPRIGLSRATTRDFIPISLSGSPSCSASGRDTGRRILSAINK